MWKCIVSQRIQPAVMAVNMPIPALVEASGKICTDFNEGA